MAQSEVKRGWFTTPGRLGDRTLEMQMQGLQLLTEVVPGKTVLDVGCAEGLISRALVQHGARSVHGVEIVADHVHMARALAEGHLGLSFETRDANRYVPIGAYDIVILLAILHKLRDPSAACRRFARAASELVVIRLPPAGAPVIRDSRSNLVPHDTGAVMVEEGFALSAWGTNGPFGEWVGYYLRKDRS